MPKKTRHYYDLDGTLSRLNNTFDFVFGFYLSQNKHIQYFIGKAILILIYLNIFLPKVKRRVQAINFLFIGLDRRELEEYFESKYKHIFLATLTPLGKKVIKKDNSKDLMLTGCIEIPARQIAKLYGLEIICTEFKYQYNKIIGIKKDTYGDLKAKFFKKGNETSIYYTDDVKSEQELIKKMDKVIEIET